MPNTNPVDQNTVQRMERVVALLERAVILSRQVRDNLGGIGGGTAAGAGGITLPSGMTLPSGVGGVAAGAFAAGMTVPSASPTGSPVANPTPFGGFAPGTPGGAGLIPYLQSNLNTHALGQFANFGAGQLSTGLQLQTQAIMNGRPDALANHRLAGSTIGGIIGGIGGFFAGGPAGVGAGIGVGSQIGGAWWENNFAPGIKGERRIADTLPLAGLYAGLLGPNGGKRIAIDGSGNVGTPNQMNVRFGLPLDTMRVPNGTAGYLSSLDDYSKSLHGRILRQFGGKTEMAPTQDEILKSAGSLSESLIGGGKNPFGFAGNSPDYVAPLNAEYGRKFYEFARENDRSNKGFSVIKNLLTVSGLAIAHDLLVPRRFQGEAESTMGRYQRRAYERYGKAGSDVLKDIEPILASDPETGGNMADILSKFGASKTYRYNQLTDGEKDDPDRVSLFDLMKASAGMRGATRSATIGGLQPRNSGRSTARALDTRSQIIASLPGGKDSLEYAQTKSAWRSADSEAFEQKTIVDFGIPRARLDGQLERLNSLPFAPGNRIALESRAIGMDRKELSSVVAFRKRRSEMGQLSEEEEYGLVQREESLKNDMVGRIGRLSMGMEDKLPALSAGRPLNFRGNSFTLAAMRASGTPIRLYGSVNGSDAASKDNFLRDLIGGEVPGVGGGNKALNTGTGRIEELLYQMLQVMMNGNSGRVAAQKPDANKYNPRQARAYDNGAN